MHNFKCNVQGHQSFPHTCQKGSCWAAIFVPRPCGLRIPQFSPKRLHKPTDQDRIYWWTRDAASGKDWGASEEPENNNEQDERMLPQERSSDQSSVSAEPSSSGTSSSTRPERKVQRHFNTVLSKVWKSLAVALTTLSCRGALFQFRGEVKSLCRYTSVNAFPSSCSLRLESLIAQTQGWLPFMQVMTMWMLAYVIHPQWIMAIGLEVLVGIERYINEKHAYRKRLLPPPWGIPPTPTPPSYLFPSDRLSAFWRACWALACL